MQQGIAQTKKTNKRAFNMLGHANKYINKRKLLIFLKQKGFFGCATLQ